MTPTDGAPDKLAMARGVARQLTATPGVSAAFLAGSVTVGLGNHTSDIDVYLVGAGLRPLRRQFAVGTTRVDVQHLPTAALRSTVDRVLATTLVSTGGSAAADADTALVVRLLDAEILAEDTALGELRARLRDNSDLVRRLLVARWLNTAHFELEDLAGQLAGGDQDAATMLARTALVSAGKAVAAAAGDLYAGSKWVWRQLERSAPARFPMAEFRSALRQDPFAVGSSGMELLENLTQTCLTVAATLGWHGVALDKWPDWRRGAGALCRTRGFTPRAYQDAVVLALPAQRRVKLRHELALVWGLCDGVSEEVVVERALSLRDTAEAYQELTPARCAEIVAKLTSSGLVEAA